MIMLLAAGVGVCVLGLLAIGFGIPISDTSFGNALLIAGVVILCTGLILLGMWLVARELANLMKLVAAQGVQAPRAAAPPKPAAAPNPFAAPIGSPAYEAPTDGAGASGSPPWAEEIAARARPRASAHDVPPIEPVAAPPPPAPPDRPARRNLLFATKRRDKADLESPAAAPPPSALEAEPRVSFESAWPNPARSNGATDRSEPATAPPDTESQATDTDRSAPYRGETPPEATPQARADLPPGVTVVRSGTVDEMAYTYYSDGSIEAQLAGESPIRFASLDALRAYVEQRK